MARVSASFQVEGELNSIHEHEFGEDQLTEQTNSNSKYIDIKTPIIKPVIDPDVKKLIIISIVFILTLIPVWTFNVLLIIAEDKNNEDKKEYCDSWQVAAFCNYSNWTVMNNEYIARVDTLVPVLSGTYTCKKPSCIISSSNACYHQKDVFYLNKKCDKKSKSYKTVAVFNFLFSIIAILLIISTFCFKKTIYREILIMFSIIFSGMATVMSIVIVIMYLVYVSK